MAWSDEELMAWLDGELPETEAARIAAAIETDAALERRIAAQRSLKQRLEAHYGPVAGEPVPERLRAMLEAGTPEAAGIVDFAAAKRDREERRVSRPNWGIPQLTAIAASLAIGLFAGQAMLGGTGGGTGDPLTLAAGDPLSRALDTQLAATQSRDATIRIGISFRDESGDYCRSFESPELAGLACKAGGEWRLALAVERELPAGEPDYRQAGSGNRVVFEYARSVMAGAPFDADAERAARDAGWGD
ncbi:MAG: hypothetical protein RLN87_02930 [Parasphingopyxis sp.]|uniref:hypothetical protein n=1 Tax=Parasphingopyxis sp. TaxID=1920299 RepID=UPI0032ED3AAF